MSLSRTFSAKKDMNTDKLAINWQNFGRVQIQFKFAFTKRPLVAVLTWRWREDGPTNYAKEPSIKNFAKN